MSFGRFGAFFGDDWDEAFDSIKSAPGAFGNIVVGAGRQVRPVDGLALALVLAGWAWIALGYFVAEDHRTGLLVLAALPTVAWLVAGAIGALVFEIGGIGVRVLGYWESYLLIGFLSLFGLVSLRLALNPKDRLVYRQAPPSDGTSTAEGFQ